VVKVDTLGKVFSQGVIAGLDNGAIMLGED
jgi:hypothetical protein